MFKYIRYNIKDKNKININDIYKKLKSLKSFYREIQGVFQNFPLNQNHIENL